MLSNGLVPKRGPKSQVEAASFVEYWISSLISYMFLLDVGQCLTVTFSLLCIDNAEISHGTTRWRRTSLAIDIQVTVEIAG